MTSASGLVDDVIAEITRAYGLDPQQVRNCIRDPGDSSAAVALQILLRRAPPANVAEICRLMVGDLPVPPEAAALP